MADIVGNGSVSCIYDSNQTFNKTNLGDEPNIPLYTFILVLMLNSIIFIMGISGNFLVVLVIARVRTMRTPTNFFLLNLSIADILVLSICQPAALMEFYSKDRWLIGEAMCKYLQKILYDRPRCRGAREPVFGYSDQAGLYNNRRWV